ncbi:MAG: ester cyclase [Gaiellaceae bacterium]
MAPGRNEETVRRLVEAFNRNDLETVLDCFAADAVLHEPYVEEPIAGTERLRDFHQVLFDAFPDETLAIEQLISTGDWVIARTVASGTQTGDFLGIPPTGRRFSVPECLVYEMREDGRICNQWTYVDSGQIAQQLGYALAPAAEA